MLPLIRLCFTLCGSFSLMASRPRSHAAPRMAGIVRLFGHAAGGRPSERLLARLGMPVGAHNADFSILLDAVSRPHMQHRPSSTHRVKQSLISGNMTMGMRGRILPHLRV
jgi:hypothetical protein